MDKGMPGTEKIGHDAFYHPSTHQSVATKKRGNTEDGSRQPEQLHKWLMEVHTSSLLWMQADQDPLPPTSTVL